MIIYCFCDITNFSYEEILLQKPKKLILIEKDNGLVEILKKKFINHNNVTIINKDLLELDLKKIVKKDIIIETLTSFKRSGANAIITYFADKIAKNL